MKGINKFADLCWEGLTLRNVKHKGIVIPYILFLVIALIFELFLIGLIFFSSYIFNIYGYNPNQQFYLSSVTLFLLFLVTVPTLYKTVVNTKTLDQN